MVKISKYVIKIASVILEYSVSVICLILWFHWHLELNCSQLYFNTRDGERTASTDKCVQQPWNPGGGSRARTSKTWKLISNYFSYSSSSVNSSHIMVTWYLTGDHESCSDCIVFGSHASGMILDCGFGKDDSLELSPDNTLSDNCSITEASRYQIVYSSCSGSLRFWQLTATIIFCFRSWGRNPKTKLKQTSNSGQKGYIKSTKCKNE